MFWYFTNLNKLKPCLKTGAKGAFLVCDPNSTPGGIGEPGETRQDSNGAEVSTTVPVGFSTKKKKDPRAVFFGEILRKIRKVRGKSIYRLAADAEVDAGYISRLENGHRNPPSPRILERFATALDVKVDLLMMAAGHLLYDPITEEPLDEKRITIKIEKALQKNGVDRESQDPGELDLHEEEDLILPLIKEGDKCVGSTEGGDSITGEVVLLIQTGEGVIQVSEILHRVEEI